jgi:hypothetical protein
VWVLEGFDVVGVVGRRVVFLVGDDVCTVGCWLKLVANMAYECGSSRDLM